MIQRDTVATRARGGWLPQPARRAPSWGETGLLKEAGRGSR